MCQEKPIPTESTGDHSLKRVYLCENMAMALLPRSVRLPGICSAQGWSARGVPGAHTTIPASPEFQDQWHQSGISFCLQQYLDYSPICISQASLTLIILLRYRYNGLTEISDKKSSSPQLVVAGQGSSLYSLGVVSVLTFSFLPFCCCPHHIWNRHLPPVCTETNNKHQQESSSHLMFRSTIS